MLALYKYVKGTTVVLRRLRIHSDNIVSLLHGITLLSRIYSAEFKVYNHYIIALLPYMGAPPAFCPARESVTVVRPDGLAKMQSKR